MILDGRALAEKLRARLRERVQQFERPPKLAVLHIGHDSASAVYVRNKAKALSEVGIVCEVVRREQMSESEVLALIENWNQDAAITGILIQFPLPAGITSSRVIEAIVPSKDVDGFHPWHVGRLVQNRPTIVPCTPRGVMRLLELRHASLAGLEAVVVGRSLIVGKPTAQLLLNADATVTTCHSHSKDLPALLKRADIVVSAIGRAEFIRGEWLKVGATIIDVGMNRRADGKLCGDFDFASASLVAGAITPVPGGVGPMTIAMLLENTLLCAELQRAELQGAELAVAKG